MKRFLMHAFKILKFLAVAGAMAYAVNAIAATPAGNITSIASNVSKGLLSIASIMEDVALVAGVGFILVAFFKFHQHKQNPTQVPISQGLALLVIGACLTLFPRLLQTPGQIIEGPGATPAKMSSNAVASLIK